jgi:hypothetical protein
MTALWTATLEPQLPIDLSARQSLGVYRGGRHRSSNRLNAARADAGRPHGGDEPRRDRLERGKTENISWPIARRYVRFSASIFGFDLPDVEQLRVPMVPEWS